MISYWIALDVTNQQKKQLGVIAGILGIFGSLLVIYLGIV